MVRTPLSVLVNHQHVFEIANNFQIRSKITRIMCTEKLLKFGYRYGYWSENDRRKTSTISIARHYAKNIFCSVTSRVTRETILEDKKYLFFFFSSSLLSLRNMIRCTIVRHMNMNTKHELLCKIHSKCFPNK